MNQKLLIISSVLPPFKDAVGESAVKVAELLNSKGVKCHILTTRDQKASDYTHLRIKSWGLLAIIDIVFFIKKNNYDQIIFEYPSPLYRRNPFISFLPFFCKFATINTVTYLHEFANYSLIGKIRIIPILLFSHKILVTDKINFEQVKKKVLNKSKVQLLSIGSNLRDSQFLYKAKGALSYCTKTTKINIVYFGYIMEGKGLNIYLNAAEKLSGEDYSFNVIGSLPENPNTRAQKIYNEIVDSPFINYLGFVEVTELSDKFNDMDVVYLPFKEGVTERRTSFMTAMGFGKIVITTRPNINIDGLIEGENVFFMDDFSMDSFNNILIQISRLSEQQILSIMEKAHNWYMKNYSDKIFIERLLKVIKDN